MVKTSYIPVRQRWTLSDHQINRLLNSDNEALNAKNFFLKAKYIIAMLIYILAFLRIIYFYIKQFFVTRSDNGLVVKTLIVNVGRGYENNNINKLFKIDESSNLEINAFMLTNYMKYFRVSLFSMMGLLLSSIREFNSTLRIGLPNNIVLLLLKGGVSRVSLYTYLRAFFVLLKKKYPSIIVYIDGAILASHASVLSEIKTIRTCHGLTEKVHPYYYPAYNSIYVFSKDEKKHLKSRGINSKVYTYPFDILEYREKTVVFFMANDILHVNPDYFSDITELFLSCGYKMYMKLHPLNEAPEQLKKEYGLSEYNWSDVLNVSNIQCIKGMDGSDVIKKIKPSFVIGWGSTSLCEALNMGVIPIDILDPSVPAGFGIYSTYKKSLNWPDDRDTIYKLISKRIDYQEMLETLKQQ
jgi:hypothetical protein